eukprot:gene17000-57628_t
MIGTFISGHVSLGASIDFSVVFAGETLDMKEFAKFSLGRSIKDMWHAGAYPLAILVGSFSGVWPYVKVLLLLWTWFVPTARLPVPSRGRLLERLDLLGKWSLIDIFVLTMTMVGFRIHINSPERLAPLLGADFYVVDVKVTPMWGLYAFTIAATSSLLINIAMVRAHRVAAAADAGDAPPLPFPRDDDSDFGDAGGGGSWPLPRLCVLLLLLLCAGVTVWGAVAPAFRFRVDGS